MLIIKRLYMENYKLFPQKEIDFSAARLSIFDGPNGYGKTSIFDAIELLITGEISRVKECESLDGKIAYKTVFLANNVENDVVLKAEFEDQEANIFFVLGAKVKSSNLKGKMANPKCIYENVDFYYMTSYDTPIEEWENYKKNSDEMGEIRKEKFGQQNVEHFTLFHYIRQEDRLSYFKQNETSRSATLDKLLGVSDQRLKLKNLRTKLKEVGKLSNNVSKDLESKKAKLGEISNNISGDTQYIKLLDCDRPWDKEEIYFGDSNPDRLLNQYLKELEEIENYVNYSDTHSSYYAFHQFMSIPEELQGSAIKTLLLIQKTSTDINEIELYDQNLKTIRKQKEKLDLQKYIDVDYNKLFRVLGIEEDKELLNEVDTLRGIAKNQSDSQRVLNNLLEIRESLHEKHAHFHDSAICPYCGYNWEAQEQLEKNFASTKELLSSLLSRDGEQYAKQQTVIKEKVANNIYKKIEEKEKEYSENELLKTYQAFGSNAEFQSMVYKAHSLFNMTYSEVASKYVSLDEITQDQLNSILEEYHGFGRMFTAEYLNANEKYDFLAVKNRYKLGDDAGKIKKESIDLKKQYINEQFYKSFNGIREEIEKLSTQKETLELIQNQMKEYADAYQNSIELYKKQIIDEIEIPFFIYSSRLLQSYQGGQGVMMKTDGESIRFTPAGGEHDVLYTMSSGQLSAVLLAFSLALNKIYAGNGIKMVLIDDPIQCMDDINMISFVELLRREFDDCQIILSTHEENFSNFIRYKFKKYDLQTKAITLKEA